MGGATVGGGGGGGLTVGGGGGGGGNAANQAAQFQMQATDMQQAQTVMTQIAADAQKQQMERWKIMQDVQTKMFEISQDVTVNKAKTADKAFNAFDGYIRG